MLNASQMEMLSICRRNNLEEKNAFVFWHPVDSNTEDREHCGTYHPHGSVFLEFCKCWVTTLLLPLGVSNSGSATAQGESVRSWVSEVSGFPEGNNQAQPPVYHWQMLQSYGAEGWGSVGKVCAMQAQGPEFDPQHPQACTVILTWEDRQILVLDSQQA